MKNILYLNIVGLAVTLPTIAHYLGNYRPYPVFLIASAIWTLYLGTLIAANSYFDVTRDFPEKAFRRLLHFPLALTLWGGAAIMVGSAILEQRGNIVSFNTKAVSNVSILLFEILLCYSVYALQTFLSSCSVRVGTLVVKDGVELKEGAQYRHLYMAGGGSLSVFPLVMVIAWERLWIERHVRAQGMECYGLTVTLSFVNFNTKKAKRRGADHLFRQANGWLRQHGEGLLRKYGGSLHKSIHNFRQNGEMVTIAGARFRIDQLQYEQRY